MQEHGVFRAEERERMAMSENQSQIVRKVTAKGGFDRDEELHASRTPLRSQKSNLLDA